jgi:hypothetical protein
VRDAIYWGASGTTAGPLKQASVLPWSARLADRHSVGSTDLSTRVFQPSQQTLVRVDVTPCKLSGSEPSVRV